MPQRYVATTPIAGANFYQNYSPAAQPPAGTVNQLAQQGTSPGLQVFGSLGTTWCYVLAVAAITANTATNIDKTTFAAGSGSGGLSGKSLIAIPNGSAGWMEVSGATLNLTMLQDIPVQKEGESDEDFAKRVAEAHAAVGENPDGSPMEPKKEAEPAPAPAPAPAPSHGRRHAA